MWRLAFGVYRFTGEVGHWASRAFTSAGALVLGAAVLTAVFGVDTTQSTAYRAFAYLALLPLLSLLLARRRRGSFAAERLLPRVVGAGERFEYRLRLTNLAPRPAHGLAVQEELGDPRPAFAQFRSALKWPGYRGWIGLVERNRIGRAGPHACPDLGAGKTVELRLSAEAIRRGRLHFDAVTIGATDTLGLVRGLTRVAAEANVLVLPRRYPLPPISLGAGRRYQQGGVSQASSVGDSEEFIGLRDYRPGDPLQRVHWKSFARIGRPVVREFQDEYFERHALVLDTFAAPHDGVAFEEAVAVAASFACTIDTQDCLLDLMFAGDRAWTFTAGRGQLQPQHLLEALAAVQPSRDAPFEALAQAWRSRAGAISGTVLVLLGWDAARIAMVEAMRVAGSPLLVLCVTAAPLDEAPAWVRRLRPGRVAEDLAAL
jgi:uncharacterized protein (DUF58 family)